MPIIEKNKKELKMSLLKCPECGHNVSSEATTCPNCGFPIKKEKIQIYPEPIDDIWIEKYKKKAFNTKRNQIIINAIILLLDIIFWPLSFINDGKFVVFAILASIFVYVLLISIVLTISALICIKTKVINIDGYNIVGYLGFFKNSLVVENVIVDTFFGNPFYSSDIYTKLPNDKKIMARFTSTTMTVREN